MELHQFRRFLAISGDFGNAKSLPTHFTPLRRRRRSAKTNLQPATLRLNVPANGRIFWCWPFRVSPPAASVRLLTRIARCSLRRRSLFRLFYTPKKKRKSSTLTGRGFAKYQLLSTNYFFFRLRDSCGTAALGCAFFFLSLSFWYRVFLPFAIFGSSRRTCSISSSVQACTSRPPILTVLGGGIFPREMY